MWNLHKRKAILSKKAFDWHLKRFLLRPDFLFRIERDAKGTGKGARPLSDYELASRLSYLLWSSMPDDELRAAAAKGLRRPGVLEAQVRRMLADNRASNLVDNFAAQWLQLRNLGRTKPDIAKFPTVDDELLDAMRRETSLFVGAVFREDRSILDFIDAPFTYLNGMLARHYGISGVSGEEFRRVELDGEQRSGLLTQGAILTVSSYPTRTSPPVRGKWVLENLLGAAPPPPPPDVPVLDESANVGTLSLRARMEQHRKDPSCSACHVLMDPIGFGLESYDAVGGWRTMTARWRSILPASAGWSLFPGREGSEENPQVAVGRFRAELHREAADVRAWAGFGVVRPGGRGCDRAECGQKRIPVLLVCARSGQ